LNFNNIKSNEFEIDKFSKKFLFSSENAVPGIYVFFPCYYINISGQGSIETKEAGPVSFTVWDLTNCHVRINLNNNVYEELDKIQIHGTFLRFKGSLSENPIKISGEALYGLYVEESEIIDLSINKDKYKRGENVDITIKNIDSNSITIETPKISVFKIFYGANYQRIFSKSFDETIDLTPNETFEWTWDQRDDDGWKIPYGEYIIAGEFPIKGLSREHTGFSSFVISIYSGNSSPTRFNVPLLLNKNFFQNHFLFDYFKLCSKNQFIKN
jgi:hypothetical protein